MISRRALQDSGFLLAGLIILIASFLLPLPHLIARLPWTWPAFLIMPFSVFCLLRPQAPVPDSDATHPPTGSHQPLSWLLTGLCLACALAASLILSGFFTWLSFLFAAAALLQRHPYTRANVPRALLLLFWIYPWPTAITHRLLQATQQITAWCSEWVLHLFGIRIWLDATTLRTDLHAYPIPMSGAGEEVAVMALLMALLLAAWFRFSLTETTTQALLTLCLAGTFNVLRIVLLVAITSPSQAGFLGESAGALALFMVFVVMILTAILVQSRQIRQQRRDRLRGAVTGALSEFPPFWHRVLRQYRSAFLIIPLAAAIAFLAFQGRPSQRLTILRDVAEDLRDQGKVPLAIELARKIADRQPEDLAWRLTLIRMLLQADQPLEADQMLSSLPPHTHEYRADIALLKAYTALLAGTPDEARHAVETLRPFSSPTPDWAMTLSEIAFALQDENLLLEHIPRAAQATINTPRLQPMVPLLYQTGSWNALIAATRDLPPAQLTADTTHRRIHALLQMGDVSTAAAWTTFALQRWPDDLRIMRPLTLLARQNPLEWQPRFNTTLIRLSHQNHAPLPLLSLLESAFAVTRPDLAWLALRKLHETAPNHPYVAFATAHFAPAWFLFQRRQLGFSGSSAEERIDIFPLLVLARHLPSGQTAIAYIPGLQQIAADGLSRDAWQRAQREAARTAFEGVDLPDRDVNLIRRHARILIDSGEVAKARQVLLEGLAVHPDSHPLHLALADLDRQSGQPRLAYERLLPLINVSTPLTPSDPLQPDWPPATIRPPSRNARQLPVLLRLIALQAELALPVSATYSANEALRQFPHDPAVRTAAAAVRLLRNRPEQAIVLLQNTRNRRLPITNELEAAALLATGRFNEVPIFRRRQLMPPLTERQRAAQPPERLPPAERLLTPPHPDEGHASTSLPASPSAWQPLLATLHRLPDAPIPLQEWLTLPLTRLEQADALHQLTRLLIAHNRLADAFLPAQLAVAAQPQDPILWIDFIRLHPNPEDILPTARSFCPDDPDLWLADLVLAAHANDQDSLSAIINEATASHDLPVDTLVRAADFLWRGSRFDQATLLIEHWRNRERHLLPAFLLGVEAASRQDNRAQTLVQIENAIEASTVVGTELYTRFLHAKAMMGSIDTTRDVINALRFMRRANPDRVFWAELLGYVRFKRGGADILEAGQEMEQAIQAGSTNRIAFIVSAEAARRSNRFRDAAQTLRTGLLLHPNDPALLNNLAYTLAQDPDSTQEAANLIPQLIPLAENNPEIRDTLALVLLRSGSQDLAQQLLSRNVRESAPDSLIWFRSQMRLAEIVARQGRPETARSMLDQLLRGARNIPDQDILAANQLLTRITSQPAEAQPPE